jgi:hypothetical protein
MSCEPNPVNMMAFLKFVPFLLCNHITHSGRHSQAVTSEVATIILPKMTVTLIHIITNLNPYIYIYIYNEGVTVYHEHGCMITA